MRTLVIVLLVVACARPTRATIEAAADYSAKHGGRSFYAVRDGRVLAQRNANTPLRIYSGTKAFWNLAALAAAEDGILNLDEHVADTITEWRGNARKSSITLRQLLDFSAGLAPEFGLHANNVSDRDAMALRAPSVASPGSAFIYGPAALQVFHEVLKRKLRGETPTRYLERRVLRRIGLGPQRYLNDRAGNPLLAAGWELSARDWAKLGQIVLANGAPVVSASSLAQCFRGSSANRAFSLGWWNNRAAPSGREFDFEAMLAPKWPRQNWRNACLCRQAPGDLVACIGSEYQRLYVIPSMRLVVVRHGNGQRFADGDFLRILLDRNRP